MRAVILSLDTGAYKAKADVAAAASLKRMLEQVGIEVRAAKAFPEDKEMLKTVLCKLADAGMVELVLTTGVGWFPGEALCAGCCEGDSRPSASRYSGSTQGL